MSTEKHKFMETSDDEDVCRECGKGRHNLLVHDPSTYLGDLSEEIRSDPAFPAFAIAMDGYSLGRGPLHSAWHWFKAGWLWGKVGRAP